ncbi:hypothetical protein [Burkholderia ubonensis]|uniref:hypothetical protein n=1 Tax=Burkholderia ubonensis TaxID=101571 RepID=UPI000AC0E24D|nr:hypothetical protein [Burkholderia ubonensis]
MATPTITYPRKSRNHRMRIRVRAAWRVYIRTTSGWVDNPTIYLLTSYTSLAFAILFSWHTLARTGHFWNNINNILFFGWAGLLLSILTLTQIKWINRAIGLPVMGIFLFALSTYIYGDAKAVTAQRLNQHFSFSTSQLTEAIDVGGRIGFAMEIAGIATLAVVAWYAVFMVLTVITDRNERRSGYWPFMFASSGGIASLTVIGALSLAATGSFGSDVIVIRAAYELDFTSNFQCDSVPKGARVLLSKMSDTTGYAMKLTFPERPFFRMEETDNDLKQLTSSLTRSYRVVNCNKPYVEMAPS